MKKRWLSAALALSLAGNVLLVMLTVRPATEARADVTATQDELSIYMAQLQHLVHKLGLSIQNKDMSAWR